VAILLDFGMTANLTLGQRAIVRLEGDPSVSLNLSVHNIQLRKRVPKPAVKPAV
jgi:hypothetical protein